MAEKTLKEKVDELIQKVRPMLQMDGGDIELVDVKDKIVYVRLKGACYGCPASVMTLKLGVERYIKNIIPEIEAVESV